MEATTVRTEFEMRKKDYRSKKEFISALEVEYHISQIDVNYVFSKEGRIFIVLDWAEFCEKPNQKKNSFSKRGHQEMIKLPIVYAT